MILYIIRGIPGSGKSELAKILAPNNAYEANDYFKSKKGEFHYDRRKLTKAHENCFKNVEYAMMDGIDHIAVANTFTRKDEYEDYIQLAQKMGYDYMEIICKGNYENSHKVPEYTIKNMANRFEY